MKRKIFTILTTGSVLLMVLTGCGASPDRASAGADAPSYVAELPDGSTVEISPEEAEEIRELQEELGMVAREYEEDYEDEYDEDYEEESETDVEAEEIFDIKVALGERIGEFETLGVKYSIYANGAEITNMNEYADSTIPEEIEYEGVTYPIVSLACIPYGVTEFDIPSHIKYIRGAFAYTDIETITIPDTIEYFDGNRAFYQCESLKNVTFLGEIETNTWSQTFHYCESLEEVTIPEGVTVVEGLFLYCPITSVSLPDSLTVIGTSAFSGLENLETIVIPENVEEIRSMAFEGSGIKHIDIPESVKYVNMGAFSSCYYLEELYIPDTVEDTRPGDGNYNWLDKMYNLKVIKFAHVNYGGKFDYISELYAPQLELAIFPDDTEEIDDCYFKYVEDKSNLTIQVPAKTVEYFQKKFPEINVVAKE